MPNTFLSLDVPRSPGVGAAAYVGNTAPAKTIAMSGQVGPGSRYLIEGSHDAATWDVLVGIDGTPGLFTGAEGDKTIDAVVQFLRVCTQTAFPTLPPPAIGLGAPPPLSPNFFAALDVPRGPGLGAPLDLLLTAGPIKTIAARGALSRSNRATVLVSMDGVRFDEVCTFDRDRQGLFTSRLVARYLRVQRDGSGPPFTVTVGAEGLFEGGGSEDFSLPSDGRGRATCAVGIEEVVAPFTAPLNAARSSRLFADFACRAHLQDAPAEAVGTIRVRLGGSPSEPDGEILLELPVASAAEDSVFEDVSLPFPRPAEPGSAIKVTLEAPAGVLALSSFTLWLRGA